MSKDSNGPWALSRDAVSIYEAGHSPTHEQTIYGKFAVFQAHSAAALMLRALRNSLLMCGRAESDQAIVRSAKSLVENTSSVDNQISVAPSFRNADA
eukprot:4217150-Pyramimonas_sp.AAC.1